MIGASIKAIVTHRIGLTYHRQHGPELKLHDHCLGYMYSFQSHRRLPLSQLKYSWFQSEFSHFQGLLLLVQNQG